MIVKRVNFWVSLGLSFKKSNIKWRQEKHRERRRLMMMMMIAMMLLFLQGWMTVSRRCYSSSSHCSPCKVNKRRAHGGPRRAYLSNNTTPKQHRVVNKAGEHEERALWCRSGKQRGRQISVWERICSVCAVNTAWIHLCSRRWFDVTTLKWLSLLNGWEWKGSELCRPSSSLDSSGQQG